jgi:RNA-directed DNA polymerase
MTVHSNDGTSWLTTLARIGEKSASDNHLVFNNLGHVMDAAMLKACFYQLDGSKAVGIDGVTKAAYEENLDENIQQLIKRIRQGSYQPKPARMTEIPKEDGSKRPLAISCLEDKLVQLAVNKILEAIYEPLFLPCSYGFRPGLNCHDALRALNHSMYRHVQGAVVEIDIRKYFNTIPHQVLLDQLRAKISDRRFIRLIDILIKAPVGKGGETTSNQQGCPQGSILSPILANIYLHHVIDEWFEQIQSTHLRGRGELIRYADDMVFTFDLPEDAERFYRVLPKRLAKYGLEMHEDKSQLLPAGSMTAHQAHQAGRRMPTFNFLGFTCYWGRSRKGYWRPKYTSRKDRFATKLKGLRNFLWKHLNANRLQALETVVRVIKGWINYHAISDNQRRVSQFIWQGRRILYKWFNRQGGNRRMTWDRLDQILKAVNYPESWKITSMFPTR